VNVDGGNSSLNKLWMALISYTSSKLMALHRRLCGEWGLMWVGDQKCMSVRTMPRVGVIFHTIPVRL